MHTISDCKLLIRDWTKYGGCGAWKSISRMADDAKKIAHYDDTHPEHTNFGGMIMGGPRLAAEARRAEKLYRLAAWVLKRIYDGREEHDRLAAIEAEKAEEARIAALPRVKLLGTTVMNKL